MIDVNQFKRLKISLSSSDDIKRISKGEVRSAETINYRTLKPEVGGLFDERIFGPTKDWECSCGKYRGIANKGITCEKCHVTVTRSRVRRERVGHIELMSPVTHIWHFKGTPSRLSYLLDISVKDLEAIIYYNAYYIVEVDTQKRMMNRGELEAEHKERLAFLEKERKRVLEKEEKRYQKRLADQPKTASKSALSTLAQQSETRKANITSKFNDMVTDEKNSWMLFNEIETGQLIKGLKAYRQLQDNYADYFKGAIGAEFVEEALGKIDLEALATELKDTVETSSGAKHERASKRLSIVNQFLKSGNSPQDMVLHTIPVIPPELRPIVQLDGGRFFYSDLNDLYRRVIICNNALKRSLQDDNSPIVINQNRRLLQEAVDSLFNNGRRGRAVTGSGNRPLKSLSDMLKGKRGRFRQNLLGKRVDYSGRSVIVVGPELKMHQCGLPKQMALELFKPFVIKRLIELSYAQNPKSARRMVDRQHEAVWDILEEVIREHPVLLNRAPTLHRLGIQAFEPLLVEGNAIKLHPLACTAFNADFDGDQMAVHLPLSVEAQAEARVLMLGANNLLKPSDGKTITMPSQDMIIGLYHLTRTEQEAAKADVKTLKYYSSADEWQMAIDRGIIGINDLARYRTDGKLITTSFGRVQFNRTLPEEHAFVNELVGKKELGDIIDGLVTQKYPTVVINKTLDAMKDFGFRFASRSGVSIAYSDVVDADKKSALLAKAEDEAAKVQSNFDAGFITDEERRSELVDIWSKCTDAVADNMRKAFDAQGANTLNTMVSSGARGNWMQVRQIAGMRGLVANPKGEIIPRPIKSNYREGLSVLEYFIASHGARKGLADTALRTADSGYLTRRLVDVSQDIIVREYDCGTTRGIVYDISTREDAMKTIWGRYLNEDAVSGKDVIAPAGSEITVELINTLLESGVTQVNARTLQTCQVGNGVCAKCYGISMATGRIVDVGEAVGIIAAQSIGEPGTQLTMRTFHTGGVAAAADITQGLPRVAELFEARTPKGEAPIAEETGRLTITETEHQRIYSITPDEKGKKVLVYKTSKRQKAVVKDAQRIEAGQQLTEGVLDPKKILRVQGDTKTQAYLISQIQEVYSSQGVDIHNKHLEVIIRQMLRFVSVIDSGETELVAGNFVTQNQFRDINKEAVATGKKPATARPELLGITKASLKTESWLSAASFQETTRVLTDAAIEGKDDNLVGLKENIIIGRKIPAGTGLSIYAKSVAEPSEEARQAVLPDFASYDDFDFQDDTELSDEFMDDVQKKYFNADDDNDLGEAIRKTPSPI